MDNTAIAELAPDPLLPNMESVSPSDLEKVMLEKASSAPVENKPEEVASMMFTMYLPRFMSLIDTLSSKDLRRLVKALVESPLNDEPFKFHSNEAKEAFNLGIKLNDAKYMMILHIFNEHSGELYNAAYSEEDTSKVENDNNGQV